MNANETKLEYLHPELTEKIISVFYEVYNELGYGFLESVYQRAMTIALRAQGLEISTETPLPVWFRGEQVGDFRADLVVNDRVVVELKAARTIEASHEAQVLNYLRATAMEVGLLLNFGPRLAIRRLVFSNERKKSAFISVNLRLEVL